MSKINYENKEAWQDDATIPDKNKVTSANMNEIKRVVNENDDKFNNYYPSNDIDSKLNAQKNMINNLEKKHNNDISTVNNNINNIKTEQTTQNKNIKTNTDKNTAQDIEIEKLKSNLIKLQAEGEEIQVNDSSELEAKIDVRGNTKQETTEGKNLLNIKSWLDNSYNTQYTENNGIYTITRFGTLYSKPLEISNEDKTLYLKGNLKNITSTKIRVEILNSSNKVVAQINETTNSTFGVGSKIRVDLSNNGDFTLENIIVSESDIPYEPYTGGQASPNPDYPQEIESVKAYNLFDKSNVNLKQEIIGSNGTTAPNDGFFVSDYIKIKLNINYRIYMQDIPTGLIGGSFCFYDKNKKFIETISTTNQNYRDKSIKVPNNNQIYFMRFNASIVGLDTLQVVESKEKKPYQPYGEIAVKQIGKNLFDKSKITKGYELAGGGKLNPNSEWFVSDFMPVQQLQKYKLINNSSAFTEFYKEKEMSTAISGSRDTIITIPAEAKYGRLNGRIQDLNTPISFEKYINDSIGYEPYKETIYPIKLGESEMNKIGNAQDYFHRINGKWHLHKEIGKYVFTGNENWIEDNKYPNSYTFYTTDIKLGTKQSFGYNIYCNHFRAINLTNVNSITGTMYATYIAIDEKIVQTVDQFKQWLKNNPTYALYELKEPTETEITDPTLIAQLDNLENAKLFKPTTILTNNSIAIMKLDYIADTKAYIDNKLSQIAIANEKSKAQIMQNTPQTIPERLENKKVTE